MLVFISNNERRWRTHNLYVASLFDHENRCAMTSAARPTAPASIFRWRAGHNQRKAGTAMRQGIQALLHVAAHAAVTSSLAASSPSSASGRCERPEPHRNVNSSARGGVVRISDLYILASRTDAIKSNKRRNDNLLVWRIVSP